MQCEQCEAKEEGGCDKYQCRICEQRKLIHVLLYVYGLLMFCQQLVIPASISQLDSLTADQF